VLAYVGAKPCHLYMIDPVALTLTMDGSDHDLDLTANTSANTVAVILELRQTAGGSPGRWVHVQAKAKGEAAWDHDGGLEMLDSGSANCYINLWSEQWIQRTDSGQEITYNINREGTTALYLVGYFEQET
jgi:hypothetical protein